MRNQYGAIPLLFLVAVIGIILFLVVASLGLSNNKTFRSLFPIFFSQAATVVNVLGNGDFEADFTNWPVNSSFWTVDTSSSYQGQKNARYQGINGGSVRRNFSGLTVGKTYKVSYWLKLNSQSNCTSANPSADCWGGTGARIVNMSNLTFQVNPPSITKANTNLGVWNKYSFQFTVNGPTTSGQLEIGPFAGPGYAWDFQVDDVKLFELPSTPIDPNVSISASTASVNSIDTAVSFSSVADDDDGSINYYFWDFGDGGKSNLQNPQYKYSSNGNYIAKLVVFDDSGRSAEAQTPITVADSNYSTIAILPFATTSSTSTFSISGTAQAGAGKTLSKIEYSTDRGIVGTASGTTNWNFNINLFNTSGASKILISAIDSQGGIVSKSVDVIYQPSAKVGFKNNALGVTQSSGQVELYDKFEATFELENGRYSNPYIPFETNVPLGMKPAIEGKGVSVEATFTSPSGKTFKQPGFIFQPYQRVISTKQLIAQGNPQWKIRFAPTELGKWTYSLSVTDASGTTTLSDSSRFSFDAILQTNSFNHGFLQPSVKDKRYFEYSDGTPFIGVGPGPSINDSFSTDTDMSKFASGSANFSRTWMSGDSIGGSSWAPWAGGIDNVSNSPGASLTTEQAYGSGTYSLTLPQQGPGARTAAALKDCIMFGFFNGQPSIKQNTNYRVLVRLKTVDVTGAGGFTLRPDSPMWGNAGDSCSQYSATPPLISYQKGTSDWHVVSANWNSSNKTKFGYLLLTLENVTGGRVYIDEVSVKEDLGNGNFGPEVLARSNFNVQNYFAQEASWNWDYGLDEFAKRGLYQKPVIEEKDDYAFGFMSPHGFGYDKGGQMAKNGASMKYQEYYWRYLIARYGYSRAIHSFEYANEQAPGSLSEGQRLAKYLKDNDPNKHMGNSSNWAGLNGGWTSPMYPDISNADAHSYAHADGNGTSWLEDGPFPLNIGSVTISSLASLIADSALFTYAHSIDQYIKNAAGNKPMIIGEAGITNGTVTLGNNDGDTTGVWWHQFIWGQLNNGGAYYIYWYDQTIKSNGISQLVVPYRQFMEGKSSDTVNTRIPLANGNYQDAQITVPAGLRGWGQRDVVNGGAHFWIYDSLYNWTTPTVGSNVSGKQIVVGGLPGKQYTVEFWDTWSGTVVKQNVNHTGGNLTLTVPTIAQKDVAVKIYPATGYPISQVIPTSQPSAVPSGKVGDIVVNGAVDIFDYNELLRQFGMTGTSLTADIEKFDTSADRVDIYDFNKLLGLFGS